MRTKGLLALVIALMLMGGIPLKAQPGQGYHHPMRIYDQLNLTEAQKTQIDKLQAEAKKEQIDRRAEIAKLRVELQQLLRAEAPGESAIQKKIGEIGSLQSTARAKRMETWFAVNRLLDQNQQKIWRQALERHGMNAGRGHRDRSMRDRMHDCPCDRSVRGGSGGPNSER